MRNVLLALVVVTLVSAASQTIAQTWQQHRPEGAGYVVEMPGEPKVSWRDVSTKIGDIKTYIATSALPPLAFVTMFSRYPEELIKSRSVDSILEGGRNGAVANVKGTLRDEKILTIDSFPGREIIIDAPSGQVVLLRYFLGGVTLVQAIVGGPAGVETNADARRFLESLHSTGAK